MSQDLTLRSNNSSDEPEAYRIGWVPFLSATIHLDSHPLIPRPETEWWVEKFIAEKKDAPFRALDLFAGSGCIGVAVLTHMPRAHITFGEFDARHLPTIEKNILSNGIGPERATIVQTDVYGSITGTYDAILANPPYLSRARLDRIEASVLDHEPVEALFAEDDGFALIAATIEGLPQYLHAGGECWVEHEPEHSVRIKTAAVRLGLSATTHQDQYGVERYSVILKS
jgi:release factor glutamine methyltransferase